MNWKCLMQRGRPRNYYAEYYTREARTKINFKVVQFWRISHWLIFLTFFLFTHAMAYMWFESRNSSQSTNTRERSRRILQFNGILVIYCSSQFITTSDVWGNWITATLRIKVFRSKQKLNSMSSSFIAALIPHPQ